MCVFSLTSLSKGPLWLWCFWFGVWTPNFWLSHKDLGTGFPLHLCLLFTISGRILALAILSEPNFCSWYSVWSCCWPTQFPRRGRGLGQALLPLHTPRAMMVAAASRADCVPALPCSQLQLHGSPFSALNWNSCRFCFIAFCLHFSRSRGASSPTLTPTLSYCFVIFGSLFKYNFLRNIFPDSSYNLGPRASYTFPHSIHYSL